MSSQWPSGFPSPLVDHSGETSSGLLDPSEVFWPIRTRSVPDEKEDLSVVLSVSQWSQFRDWVEVSLNGGCDFFDADWISSLGFVDDYKAARIIMPYRSVYLKDYWRVSFTLELLPISAPDVVLTYVSGDHDVYFADPAGGTLTLQLSGYPEGFRMTIVVVGNGTVSFVRSGLDLGIGSGTKEDLYLYLGQWR